MFVHVTLYKVNKECYPLRSCHVDVRRTLFMVEQVFLLVGRFGQCIMLMHDAWCWERWGRADKNFYVKFFLSCRKYEFYFTPTTWVGSWEGFTWNLISNPTFPSPTPGDMGISGLKHFEEGAWTQHPGLPHSTLPLGSEALFRSLPPSRERFY